MSYSLHSGFLDKSVDISASVQTNLYQFFYHQACLFLPFCYNSYNFYIMEEIRLFFLEFFMWSSSLITLWTTPSVLYHKQMTWINVCMPFKLWCLCFLISFTYIYCKYTHVYVYWNQLSFVAVHFLSFVSNQV